MSQHIYLTGYRGSGKTSVGVLIAKELHLPLIDLDEKIEADAGKPISEIFREGGEPMFRNLESEALREVSAGAPSVISLGGGAIIREENRDRIRESGICLWLDGAAESLARRIRGDQSTAERRPSLTSHGLIDEIAILLRQRRPWYREVATAKIDTTDKSIDQVAAEAIELLKQNP